MRTPVLDEASLLNFINQSVEKEQCQFYCKTSEQNEYGELLPYAVNCFCFFLSYGGWLDSSRFPSDVELSCWCCPLSDGQQGACGVKAGAGDMGDCLSGYDKY